jgi:acetyl esterase/lipase
MISSASNLRNHRGTTEFTSREMIEAAFGQSDEELWAASPMAYVRSGLPPFLVISAEGDPEGLQSQSKEFADALRDADVDVYYIRVLGRDHFSIVRRFGPSDDTTANAIRDFVAHFAGPLGRNALQPQ